jgi:predicted P-loop ATPase
LLTDDRGRPYANLANALIAFRNDVALAGYATFDDMLQDKMAMAKTPEAPGSDPAPSATYPRPLNDDDIARLQEWLQHKGLPRIGRETVWQAVETFAREHSFHPVRDWLSELEWDGVERLSHWLIDFLGAEGPFDYLANIGRMFLIAMVARIMTPGCKADYVMVLEGGQGAMKSQACAVLAGEYFTDNVPPIHTKDASQHLRGKWLCELSELAAIAKADPEGLKAFLTRTHERYRPPYGRADVIEPRQCVMVGTTNKHVYIRDDTGARRFWPIKIAGVINIKGLREARSQLFAEAVARWREGEQWWPDAAFEAQFIKPQQETRIETDPWEDRMTDYLADKNSTRVLDVATGCLGFDMGVGRLSTSDARRISSILQALGFVSKRSNGKNTYVRGFLAGA